LLGIAAIVLRLCLAINWIKKKWKTAEHRVVGQAYSCTLFGTWHLIQYLDYLNKIQRRMLYNKWPLLYLRTCPLHKVDIVQRQIQQKVILAYKDCTTLTLMNWYTSPENKLHTPRTL